VTSSATQPARSARWAGGGAQLAAAASAAQQKDWQAGDLAAGARALCVMQRVVLPYDTPVLTKPHHPVGARVLAAMNRVAISTGAPPRSCDTFVALPATSDGRSVVFGKHSWPD